ncbi:MAG TPA: glutamate 5-kinase, partial [Thermoleophilaceae bacterium]
MKERVVVKVGSNTVLDRAGRFRPHLAVLATELAALHRGGADVALVTSGGIARGLRSLHVTRRTKRMKRDLQAASAVGQPDVYSHFEQLFARQRPRLATAQVLFTFAEITELHHFRNVQQALTQLVEWRVVPIINENDTTTMDDITFENNDYLAAQVANMLRATRLVLFTNVDGVFTANPQASSGAELIEEITDVKDALTRYRIKKGAAQLGTGGMYSKVVAAEMAAASGTRVTIANGVKADSLRAALRGERVGTIFPPAAGRQKKVFPRRDWIRSRRPKGSIYVDAGAARALRTAGASLLPVGVVRVGGSFGREAIVDVLHEDELLGKGIVALSASQL